MPEQASAKIDRIAEESRGSLTPHDIKRIAEVVTATHLMIPIIDEFDRVRDEYAVAMFTDTIKHLSDHALNTTLILVGVGDTIDDLIREHHSIERSLEQVLMPRMSPQESAEILRHGQNVTGVRFTADAESLIISLSQGLPHYTHLLGLNATRAAVDDASWRVEEGHVEAATKGAIEGSLQSLRRSFHTATSSPRAESLFKQVLLACALAATDELGYFAAADVRTPMRRITGKPYDIPSYSQHLKQFCEEERGAVLQRIGPERRTRFRFTNPLLQPFVTITGLADGLISKQDVRGLFGLQRGGGRPS